MPAPIVPSPTTPTFTAAILRKKARRPPVLLDMKLALLVILVLLAVLGAFVELVRGRRPVLVARPA